MDTCPECGNHDLAVTVVDGASVLVCGLCGERVGQRRALETLADREEADHHGHQAAVWPLVRVLKAIPDVVVVGSTAGDAAREQGPEVRFELASLRGLEQVENLARSLRLVYGAVNLPWTLEVDAERDLAFVLRVRPTRPWSPEVLSEAWLDVEAVARQIERHRRAAWWGRGGSGQAR